MSVREEMSQQKLLSDAIYESIRDNILKSVYKPGMKLTEKYFADYLSVSRTPIREALKKLAREGLVNEIPNKGAYVTEFAKHEIQDISEALSAMERQLTQRYFCLSYGLIEKLLVKVEMILFFLERRNEDRVNQLICDFFEFILDAILEPYLKNCTKSMNRLLKCRQMNTLCQMKLEIKQNIFQKILLDLKNNDLNIALQRCMSFKMEVQR